VRSNRVWTVVKAGVMRAGREVARQLKFSPATQGGKPIPYWKKVSVQFNLK